MAQALRTFLVLSTTLMIFLNTSPLRAQSYLGTPSFYNTQVDASDWAIVNPYVMSHINDLAQHLTLIAPPSSSLSSQVLKLEESHALSFTQFATSHQRSLYSQVSHDLGVCGGFIHVEASDVGRIQNHLLQQLRRHEQESQHDFKFYKAIRPEVQKMVSQLSVENFKTDLNFITQFPHRQARNSNNVEIKSIQNYILESLPQSSVSYSVDLVSHKRVPQKSIHIQIPGQNPTRHIVLGGHIDSINTGWGSLQAPGADDNASGSTALIQILRAILQNNYQPQNTIDFFWYAGEELGLIGSSEIAKSYRLQNTNVIAALQLDMLGVPDQAHNIFLEQDFSSPKLNQLLRQVATLYFPHLQIKDTSCGYPCSDHSSWYQENYPVTFPTSGNPRAYQTNRLIHTAKDLPSTINWDYALNVTKLSLAFVLTADQEL